MAKSTLVRKWVTQLGGDAGVLRWARRTPVRPRRCSEPARVGFQNSAVAGDLRFQAATPCPCWRTAIELRPDRAGLPRTESGTTPSATGAVAARRARRSRA